MCWYLSMLHIWGLMTPSSVSDFAGVVTRLAATNNDHSFAIDNKAYDVAFDMLRPKSFVSVDLIAKMPMGLSFEEASAFPLVFLTVLFALEEQAGLKLGDCILIHSADGGVGSVAVEYAHFVGAEMYATDSPSKHEYLQRIDIKNISTINDEAVFVWEMRWLLGDTGFDVVLSTGNLIDKSSDLLGK